MISREEVLRYPDGTWICTDREVTEILDIRTWDRPKPQDSSDGIWWRRKQLLDHLARFE